MRKIQERGRLIAGVDQTTLLFGYRNPETGAIEGFDIDLLREVARAIFGDPSRIELKVATSPQRLPLVMSGDVDIVASAITVNCSRRQDVDFSSIYYLAHQKVLVMTGSGINGVPDLKGKTVCATIGSTSVDNIRKIAPDAVPYSVTTRADCLVALQEGWVQSITSDNTILDGFHAQDPNTQILPEALTDEPYGMAMQKGHPEFVRFVNGVLDRSRTNGTLESLNERWLQSTGEAAPPPTPRYQDGP
jgi:polar amino acid transport system substrate-binding protein